MDSIWPSQAHLATNFLPKLFLTGPRDPNKTSKQSLRPSTARPRIVMQTPTTSTPKNQLTNPQAFGVGSAECAERLNPPQASVPAGACGKPLRFCVTEPLVPWRAKPSTGVRNPCFEKRRPQRKFFKKVLFYRTPRGGGFGPGGFSARAPKNVDLNRDGAQPSAELCDPNADWARRVHQNGVLSDRGASFPLGSTLRLAVWRGILGL